MPQLVLRRKSGRLQHQCTDVLQSLKVLLQRLHRQNAQCDDPAGAPLRHKYLGYLTEIMPTQRSLHATGGCIGTVSNDHVSRLILVHGFMALMISHASTIRRLHGFAIS